MKLISISIERFGARSNLHLENLSAHLNVVYGPNGSGKSTITQFVRWMLFGSEDAGSQRYLVAGDHRVGGMLQIEDGHGRRKTLARHLQHTHQDYVRVIGSDGEEGYAFDARRLTGLDLPAWQHVFSFGFDQPPVVEQLLRAAQGNSFTVTFDENQLQRLREMLQRLEEMRRGDSWSAGDDHAYAALAERRRQLRAELDACERRRVEQLRERDRELETLLAEIASEQRRLQEARDVLQRTESYLAARAREADQAAVAAASQRERWLASRREELAKLDEQIQQWHQMLGRIRQRHEMLQAQLAHGSPVAAVAGRLDEADLRAALLSLGHALNDIDEDLRNGGVHRTSTDASPERLRRADQLAEGCDATGRADYYREILSAAWQSMRDDVHRLCRELQNQQEHAQYAEQARELDHLRRCDAELSSLIESLDRRRVSLRSTPELLLRPGSRTAPQSFEGPLSLDGPLSLAGPGAFARRSSHRETHWFDAYTPSSASSTTPTSSVGPQDVWTDYRESLGRLDGRDPRAAIVPDAAKSPWPAPRSEREVDYRDVSRNDGLADYRDDGRDAHRSPYQAHYRFDVMQHRTSSADAWVEGVGEGLAEANRSATSSRNGHARWTPQSAMPGAAESVAREHDPVWQARLLHLARRRDYLASRVRELEGRVRSLEIRRESLQASRLAADVERSLEVLQRELASVEDRMRQLEVSQRRREEMQVLERQIEQLRQQLAPSEILRDASAFLARFTCGTHRAVRVSDRLQVTVEDDRGQWLDQTALSRGTRDQTYLALALALVDAFRRRDIELPLVLNDIFIHIDGDRAEATAEVLAQFAAQGHQVLLFTHQEDSLQRFGALGARLYTLRERPRPLDPPAAPAWNAPRGYAERLYLDTSAPLPSSRPLTYPHQPEVPVVRPSAEVGRVTEHSRLSELEWLDAAVVDRCATAGVHSVGEFLALDADEAARRFALRGWDAAELVRCQSHLTLQCFVGLSPSDAALLVACGVDDPEDLAYVDVSDLHRRIERFLANSEARARYGSIARFERSRLARWIQAARRSHYRRHRPKMASARRVEAARPESLRPQLVAESNLHEALRAEVSRAEAPRAEVSHAVMPQAEISRAEVPQVLVPRSETPRARAAADSPELRVARPRRMEAAPIARPVEPAAEAAASGETPREPLRFFLKASDPIVDAPSIGPKTAERFQAIGLETVGQLLEVEAGEAARQINYRRITAELVQSWQQQTELVCRVPNLRGHDAQILVACEVVSAEQLAQQDATTLNAQVQAYIGSVEGKRTLRGAKTPELAEVSAWIRWARHARQRTASSV